MASVRRAPESVLTPEERAELVSAARPGRGLEGKTCSSSWLSQALSSRELEPPAIPARFSIGKLLPLMRVTFGEFPQLRQSGQEVVGTVQNLDQAARHLLWNRMACANQTEIRLFNIDHKNLQRRERWPTCCLTITAFLQQVRVTAGGFVGPLAAAMTAVPAGVCRETARPNQ